MNRHAELIARGWVLGLARTRRGYTASAARAGDLIESFGATPEEAYARAWEVAEQRSPRFECDSCSRWTADLRELVSVGNAQVCGGCYVLEEAAEYEERQAYHG